MEWEGCEMVGFFGFDRGIRILDQPDGLGATLARMSRPGFVDGSMEAISPTYKWGIWGL